MTKLVFILVFGVIFLATFLACKKEQPDFNKEAKDPCACASEVSADFDILEQSNTNIDYFFTKTDAVLSKKNVHFRALEEDAEYTWYIGADIETEQETFKYFDEEWTGSTIPITLVVKKEPNLTCFPEDDGYDSITKTFKIFDICDTNIMESYFRVARANSSDSFDIKFNFSPYFIGPGIESPGTCVRLDFYNYDGNGSDCVGYNYVLRRNYRQFQSLYFNHNGGDPNDCNRIAIINCHLDLNGVFTINYETGHSMTNDKETHLLLGRKMD